MAQPFKSWHTKLIIVPFAGYFTAILIFTLFFCPHPAHLIIAGMFCILVIPSLLIYRKCYKSYAAEVEKNNQQLSDEITEKDRLAEQLEYSKTRFHNLLQNIPIAVGCGQHDGTITFLNNKFIDLFGYEREKLPTLNAWWERAFPDKTTRQTVVDMWTQDHYAAYESGSDIHRVLQITCKDGSVKTVDALCAALGNETLVVFHDISQRLEMENALKKEKGKAERYLKAAGVLFLALDRNGTITLVNDLTCHILGYTEKELLGMNWFNHFLPKVLHHSIKQIFDQLMAGEIQGLDVYENKIVSRDGMEHTVRWHNTLLKDDHGEISGVLSSGIDISERVDAQQELSRTEALLLASIDQISSGIIVADTSGKFFLANASASEILKTDTHQLLTMSINDIQNHWAVTLPNGSTLPVEELPLSRALYKGEPSTNRETRIQLPDGTEKWLLLNAVPIRDPQQNIMAAAVLFSDITEHKYAEEERLALEKQMQQAQKLESLGVLAGGIAHDFNNLLMGILGNTDLAMDEISPYSPARTNIQDIATAAKRATELCKQMLAYSGKGRFLVTEVNINQIIEEMTHLLEVSISKKADLRLQLEAKLPAVEADATQLRQIVMNLITNASDALEDNQGVISLKTGMLVFDTEQQTRQWMYESDIDQSYVYIEVGDTGCGMTDEIREKIFDPFFTQKFTGRGLGLAAVLGIVHSHKGNILVESEYGKGTVFTILFPALDHPADMALEPTTKLSTWEGSGTILLVDDEQTVQLIGTRMLKKAGFDVILAKDGEEAVECFKKHHQSLSCAILDLTMPKMDGRETYHEFVKINDTVPVILSSGYNEAEIEQRFAGEQLAGFIQKPYQYAALSKKLQDVIKKHSA